MSDFMVGWRERVALPDLGITLLKCKVDTGAKNSALHAFYIEPFDKAGELWVRFTIHLDEIDDFRPQTCEAKVQDVRDVTDSGGNVTRRFFIETKLLIGQQQLMIPLSLTDRDTMKFKMLLGRTALRKAGFVVNPKASFLQKYPGENEL